MPRLYGPSALRRALARSSSKVVMARLSRPARGLWQARSRWKGFVAPSTAYQSRDGFGATTAMPIE